MKTKSVKALIKEYFFLHSTERLRVRQIERAVEVPLPSVIRYTKELEKENILRSNTIAGVKFYSADRTEKQYLLEKKSYNLSSLFSSDLVNFIVKEYSNPNVVVFGSYSKGEDVENSDIDLYIETSKREINDMISFEKKLQRKIQLFVYKDIKRIKNKELANNILNGITLNGFVEVFK